MTHLPLDSEGIDGIAEFYAWTPLPTPGDHGGGEQDQAPGPLQKPAPGNDIPRALGVLGDIADQGKAAGRST
jgi:hypothetical protein